MTLAVNTTITIDFTLALAGVQEALTVTGEAPLIEVTQSKVASSIEATELENLPMITRTVSGMLALLPGAVQIAPHHRSKENVGSVSYGGGSGTNVIPTVDGADNRDNQYRRTADDLHDGRPRAVSARHEPVHRGGRPFGAGAALTMVTKSGTNAFHGSGFLFARDEALNAKDYFTEQANAEKVPFSRQQFGGSHRRADPAQPRCSSSAPSNRSRGHRACRCRTTCSASMELLVGATKAGSRADRAGQSEPSACRGDSDEPPDVHASRPTRSSTTASR